MAFFTSLALSLTAPAASLTLSFTFPPMLCKSKKLVIGQLGASAKVGPVFASSQSIKHACLDLTNYEFLLNGRFRSCVCQHTVNVRNKQRHTLASSLASPALSSTVPASREYTFNWSFLQTPLVPGYTVEWRYAGLQMRHHVCSSQTHAASRHKPNCIEMQKVKGVDPQMLRHSSSKHAILFTCGVLGLALDVSSNILGLALGITSCVLCLVSSLLGLHTPWSSVTIVTICLACRLDLICISSWCAWQPEQQTELLQRKALTADELTALHSICHICQQQCSEVRYTMSDPVDYVPPSGHLLRLPLHCSLPCQRHGQPPAQDTISIEFWTWNIKINGSHPVFPAMWLADAFSCSSFERIFWWWLD